jgi:hypothetical protein
MKSFEVLSLAIEEKATRHHAISDDSNNSLLMVSSTGSQMKFRYFAENDCRGENKCNQAMLNQDISSYAHDKTKNGED